jgi:hypothetical protein
LHELPFQLLPKSSDLLQRRDREEVRLCKLPSLSFPISHLPTYVAQLTILWIPIRGSSPMHGSRIHGSPMHKCNVTCIIRSESLVLGDFVRVGIHTRTWLTRTWHTRLQDRVCPCSSRCASHIACARPCMLKQVPPSTCMHHTKNAQASPPVILAACARPCMLIATSLIKQLQFGRKTGYSGTPIVDDMRYGSGAELMQLTGDGPLWNIHC